MRLIKNSIIQEIIDLTPYEQAKRYNDHLPYDERARWIVTSNFEEIWIYDMNVRVPEPLKINLIDLQDKFPLLDFLVKKEVKKISNEMEVSIKAGEIVGILYVAFLEQYKIPDIEKNETPEQKEKREHKLRSLNALCVRLVFCLYAEDFNWSDVSPTIFGAVFDMAAYGFSLKMTEEDCVAALMKMYQKFVKEK